MIALVAATFPETSAWGRAVIFLVAFLPAFIGVAGLTRALRARGCARRPAIVACGSGVCSCPAEIVDVCQGAVPGAIVLAYNSNESRLTPRS